MNAQKHNAVCIRNEGHEESLEGRKIYEILSDPHAAARGYLRVIDEDEDYLYPSSWFMSIDLPRDIEAAFASATPNYDAATRARE